MVILKTLGACSFNIEEPLEQFHEGINLKEGEAAVRCTSSMMKRLDRESAEGKLQAPPQRWVLRASEMVQGVKSPLPPAGSI